MTWNKHENNENNETVTVFCSYYAMVKLLPVIYAWLVQMMFIDVSKEWVCA